MPGDAHIKSGKPGPAPRNLGQLNELRSSTSCVELHESGWSVGALVPK